MVNYMDLQNKRLEDKLSQLGALVSLAEDDVISAERNVQSVKIKLQEIQQEIEQIYITLNEPLLLIKE